MKNYFDLKGHVAVVTGASTGLGLQMAKAFANQGANLVLLARRLNLLEENAENCRVLQINNPILTRMDLMKIKAMKREGFRVETVSLLYYKNTPLERAVERLFVACDN